MSLAEESGITLSFVLGQIFAASSFSMLLTTILLPLGLILKTLILVVLVIFSFSVLILIKYNKKLTIWIQTRRNERNKQI